jgi:ATP-dependent DNA helicase RecQ
LALPKSVEQYYQEAGRAGRDGNPADCILLWRKQDAGLLGFFANQITDSAERDRAWQRYHTIRGFAESGQCRHRQICRHFGETPKWPSCGACDVCGGTPGWLTEVAAPVTTRPAAGSAGSGRVRAAAAPVSEADQELRDFLREWRRTTAKEQGVPAYVVLHDTTLDEICRLQPTSMEPLLKVNGIGERKADMYGQAILAALKRYREGARAQPLPGKKTAPALETLRLLAEGKTLEEIAQLRGRQLSTVVNAVAGLVEAGQVEFQPAWIDRNKQSVIAAECSRVGLDRLERLKPLKDALPAEITYDEIRLVLAQLRRVRSQNKTDIPA